MTLLLFKGLSAFWKSRSVIQVAADVQADSWQLETAGEKTLLSEWNIWLMEKQNKWLDEVRCPLWRTNVENRGTHL